VKSDLSHGNSANAVKETGLGEYEYETEQTCLFNESAAKGGGHGYEQERAKGDAQVRTERTKGEPGEGR